MTQRASTEFGRPQLLSFPVDNDRRLEDTILEDDVDFRGLIGFYVGEAENTISWFQHSRDDSGTRAYNTWLHCLDLPIALERRERTPLILDPLWLIRPNYWNIHNMQNRINQIDRQLQELRNYIPKVVLIEEIPKKEAKNMVEEYFKKNKEADIEELMLNLKIPIRTLVEIIDELKNEGKLSPKGE